MIEIPMWNYIIAGFAGGCAFMALVCVGCHLLDRNATRGSSSEAARHNDANELRGEDIRKVK